MKKSNLRATAALQALALLGAGLPVAFIAAAPAAAQDYASGAVHRHGEQLDGSPGRRRYGPPSLAGPGPGSELHHRRQRHLLGRRPFAGQYELTVSAPG